MRGIRWSGLVVIALAGCEAPGAPPPSSSTSALAGSDRLEAGEGLSPGEAISAGGTSLVYQGDNNLVLYQNGSALWATMAGLGAQPARFEMQGDCNAVVYAATGAVWSTETSGQGAGCRAQVIEGDWFVCSGATRVFSARGGGDCGGGGSSGGLEADRVRLLDTWIARTQPGAERCAAWASLSPSARQIFLIITHRLSLYTLARPAICGGGGCPSYTAGGTMLSHIQRVYAIRGFDSGTESCGFPPFCGASHGDESRMFLAMDPDLYGAMALAFVLQIDDSGFQGWSRAPLISDVAGGVPFYDYFRNSHDAGGPHAPFDWSDESKGGRTDAPGSPTAQIQFWSADAGWQPSGDGHASSPVFRPGVEGVVDPYLLEIDQDWDLCHHSDPSSCGRDQEYIDDYGDYQRSWSPPCSGGGGGPTGCSAMQAGQGIRNVASVAAPVFQPDPASCGGYCTQQGATACEWFQGGDCYAEFGGSPTFIAAGGWWAAICQ